ncbi:MAG TPA: hypothetical protein VEJ63_02920, partial [Planctomycetota bacterium]|nr:hypothetical protein [Planctomycetota bacterium]
MGSTPEQNSEPAPDAPREPAFSHGPSDISCEQARRQIERFVEDNDLKETERVLLSKHVKACAACHAVLDQAQRVQARLKDAFSTVETSRSFQQRLKDALLKTEILPAPEAPASKKPSTPVSTNIGTPQTIRQSQTQTRNSEPELIEAKVTGPLSEISDAPTRRLETGAHVRQRSVVRTIWAARVPVAALLLIGLGIGMIYVRSRNSAPDDAPPTLMAISGSGTVTKDNGLSQPLTDGHVLQPKELLNAGRATLSMTLTSGQSPIARVLLAPGSALRAQSRRSFTVTGGSVYFQVFKHRPRASANETFEVHAGTHGTVRVTGTAFVIEMSTPDGALVAVEEGSVDVRQPDGVIGLAAGQELVFGPGRRPRDSNLAARLAWMNPPAVVSTPPALVSGTKPAAPAVPPVVPRDVKPAQFDWSADVGPLALYGKTLAEGVELLAEKLEQPAPLVELVEHARKF